MHHAPLLTTARTRSSLRVGRRVEQSPDAANGVRAEVDQHLGGRTGPLSHHGAHGREVDTQPERVEEEEGGDPVDLREKLVDAVLNAAPDAHGTRVRAARAPG